MFSTINNQLMLITGEPYTEGGQTQHCSYEAPGWRTQEGDQGNAKYTFPELSFGSTGYS